MTTAARLWDAPTRIVHWALVAAVAFSWWSHEAGRMDWHRLSGYTVVGLLVFRLYWGVVGSESARFASFVKGPGAAMAYLRAGSPMVAGHNPLGAWSVVAMFAVLVAHVGFGMFAVDVDGLESGPLSYLVDFDTGRAFAAAHEWSFRALYVLIGLHLAAVVYYLLVKRRNLIGAMVTGRGQFETDPGLAFAPAWRIVVGVLLAVTVAVALAKGLKFS